MRKGPPHLADLSNDPKGREKVGKVDRQIRQRQQLVGRGELSSALLLALPHMPG